MKVSCLNIAGTVLWGAVFSSNEKKKKWKKELKMNMWKKEECTNGVRDGGYTVLFIFLSGQSVIL